MPDHQEDTITPQLAPEECHRQICFYDEFDDREKSFEHVSMDREQLPKGFLRSSSQMPDNSAIDAATMHSWPNSYTCGGAFLFAPAQPTYSPTIIDEYASFYAQPSLDPIDHPQHFDCGYQAPNNQKSAPICTGCHDMLFCLANPPGHWSIGGIAFQSQLSSNDFKRYKEKICNKGLKRCLCKGISTKGKNAMTTLCPTCSEIWIHGESVHRGCLGPSPHGTWLTYIMIHNRPRVEIADKLFKPKI